MKVDGRIGKALGALLVACLVASSVCAEVTISREGEDLRRPW